MKLRFKKRTTLAMTLVELLVVIAVLAVFVGLLLPVLAAAKRRASKINCISNLKQVELCFRIWEGDNNSMYPMAVSITNGGAMEAVATGDVVTCFRCMTNELSTPKILICPIEVDSGKMSASNFLDDLNNSHISYFIGVDAAPGYPKRIMCGDANFLINGTPVKSGLVQYPTNTSIAWGPGRHEFVPDHHFWERKDPIVFGNVGYADGSVDQLLSVQLQAAFVESDVATNRLAIP
jgi:competence protein ComGC